MFGVILIFLGGIVTIAGEDPYINEGHVTPNVWARWE